MFFLCILNQVWKYMRIRQMKCLCVLEINQKLAFEERMQLMYDKGERFFEDKPVPEADIEDIDLAFVEKYIAQIGYSKTAMEYLRENKGFIKEKMGKCR